MPNTLVDALNGRVEDDASLAALVASRFDAIANDLKQIGV
jgi:hypothetical protein